MRAARSARLLLVACCAGTLAVSGGAQTPPTFEEFLASVRTEALARGISQATLDRALANLQVEPVVVARDRAQPEAVQSLDAYLAQRLSARTINTAREMHTRHGALLARIEAAYGVPGPVMVAIWGLESNFGKFTGTYPTISSLATLAYDGRRPLFRTELLHALAIVDQRQLAPDDLKGSWAGAMGQPQFMPSSFLKHAVDFDGDQQVDIWTSEADVFGSMANYLKAAGWREGERWGREVRDQPRGNGQDRSRGADALQRVPREPRDDGGTPAAGVAQARRHTRRWHAAPGHVDDLGLARARNAPALPRLSELRGRPGLQLLELLRGQRGAAGRQDRRQLTISSTSGP